MPPASAPAVWPFTEVLIVNERLSPGIQLVRLFTIPVLNGLIGGFALMLLIPLVGSTFDLWRSTPGYWPCAGIVVLARITYRSSLVGFEPTSLASRRRRPT